MTDSSSWKRMLAASGTHVQKSMACEVRSRNEALARGNGGLNKHTLACAGEDIIGVRVLTCHMWAVGRIWRRGARVEEPEPVRIGTHRFEPYLRLHVAHVGRDDKALHGRHYISQPRSIEQRDARACPSGREAVATYPGLLSQLCAEISQSFSLQALRELGPALRSSRRELSDGTLWTIQLPRGPRLHVTD